MVALSLLVLLVAELYAAIFVAEHIGILNTIGLMLLISLVGAWVVKRVGFGVWRRAQVTLAEGGTPHNEAIDGLIVLLAGVLLVVPGFVTAAIGALLLLPPVRALMRGRIMRSFRTKASLTFRVVDGFGRRVDFRGGQTFDTSASEVDDRPPRRPELGA